MKNFDTKVSVIMGVYNQWDKQILLDAVNSILNQTMSDFEFIIYDDGSDEEAGVYLKELSTIDERIRLIGKEENHGLAFSLNQCIRKANGKFIARMDADDKSLPLRFEKQIAFLETHPEYMWCGTNTYLFDANGVRGERVMPEIPQDTDFLKYSPYVHPTVMYRSEIFELLEGYDESMDTLRCEDYEIFMRFHQAGYRGYNIQENLFQYREDQASFQKRTMKARVQEAKLRHRNFKEMKLLWPLGWVQVLRPVIAGLVPNGLLLWLKRKEAENASLLQSNFAGENNL